MSKAKHTPGPWIYNEGGQVLNADGRLIAAAWFPEPMPDSQEEREPGESWLDASTRLRPKVDEISAQMEKNARLMAAAPELLEACVEMLAEMMVWEDHQGTHPAAIKARAAIAKATGEQK